MCPVPSAARGLCVAWENHTRQYRCGLGGYLMRYLLSLLLLFTPLAFGQVQQRPSDDEINAIVQTVAAQRNAAQDQVATLAGRIATLEKALKDAQAKECKPEPKK